MGSGPAKQAPLTSRRFPVPLWPANIPHIPTPPHCGQRASSSKVSKQPQISNPPGIMFFHPDSPHSPWFSPTLGSIPEVFEYEPLEAHTNQNQEAHDGLCPESSTVAKPRLSRATSRSAIIQSPPRRTISALSISKLLRRVLDADLMRRRRIMRVYLKAIMFLKYMWRANERYGNVMLSTGMYMPR